MDDKHIFKPGPVKLALGWLVVLGAVVALLAMIRALVQNFETQTEADLWSAVAIGAFLLGLLVAGFAIQRFQWTTAGQTISVQHLFGRRSINVRELGGFGKLIITVSVFPLAHIELYDHDLKPVLRLPVTFKDLPAAEAWFADRIPYVINEGSAALPKRRLADMSKGGVGTEQKRRK